MSEKLLPCPFCQKPLTLGGGVNPYGRCETPDCWLNERRISISLEDPKQLEQWNRRTPAPEGEACPHDAYETDAAGQAVRCVDCGMAIASAASPAVPAPEGVFVSETCEGELCWCGKPAVRKVGEEFADDEPNPNRHNLTRYICAHHFAELMGPAGARSVGIAPVVPVGVSREEIAEILKDEVLTDGGIIMSSEPSSTRRLRIAARIIAALRPTDTGSQP